MKITVGLLFGGRSVENEISVVTALQTLESMDKERYEIVPIYIAKSGKWYSGEKHGTIYLDPEKGQLPIGILQNFLDEYLSVHLGVIDYIHGEDVLKNLAKEPNSIGFALPVIDKNKFFKGIIEDGVFPRKTFSTGHAQEKRYYLEGRKIK